jgi:hypothetical protein
VCPRQRPGRALNWIFGPTSAPASAGPFQFAQTRTTENALDGCASEIQQPAREFFSGRAFGRFRREFSRDFKGKFSETGLRVRVSFPPPAFAQKCDGMDMTTGQAVRFFLKLECDPVVPGRDKRVAREPIGERHFSGDRPARAPVIHDTTLSNVAVCRCDPWLGAHRRRS